MQQVSGFLLVSDPREGEAVRVFISLVPSRGVLCAGFSIRHPPRLSLTLPK